MEMKTVYIRDLGDIITGSTPTKKNPDNYGDFALWIKPTDMDENNKYTRETEEMFSERSAEACRSRLVPKDSILVPCIGTVGTKLTMSPIDCFTNQSVNAIVPNEDYDNHYIYYLIRNFLPALKGFNKGTASGREYIAKSAFENIEINVHADLAIQQKIGKLLSAYDDLIENCRRQIALLEEAVMRIFYHFFGCKKQNAILENLADNVGRGIRRKQRDNFTYYTPIDCLPKKSLAYTQTKPIFEAQSSLQSYKANDIIFGAMRVYFHKVCIAQKGGITRTTCIILNAKELNYWAYLVSLMFSSATINWASQNSKEGTTMPYITWDILKQLPIYLPSISEAEKYNALASPYLKTIVNLAKTIVNAAEARDRLLPKLMSGELNVE